MLVGSIMYNTFKVSCFALQHNWTVSVQLHQFLGCIGMAWHSSAVICGSSNGSWTAACFRVVMSWGDHWPLSWSIKIFCAGPQSVTWTSVTVCWWNWLSHVCICTLPGCGCLVCYKTCNKQILWIPLCILSIYFSIWRDNKLQFSIHTSLKILKVLLMKLKEILCKRPKIRSHTEQRKQRSSICGKTDTEGNAWVLNNAHYNRNNKGERIYLTKVLWICLPH